MREGSFNLSLAKREGKIVVHCYGHGGSGWTTLFGSVSHVIRLFEKDAAANKKTPVRIIGSGCMGLTAAIELKRLGYNVTGISTKEIHDIPSWRAAGYFALVSIKTSAAEQETLNAIGIDTFKTFQSIEAGNHAYLSKETVRYMPVYCSKETEAGVEELEARGLIPPKEEVTLDFGNGVQHINFVKYMTYFMDTTRLMQELLAAMKELGIPIEKKEVCAFEEVDEEIIFNCTGLGAKELTCDEKLTAVRGHFYLLNESAGEGHMEYMIYTTVQQEGQKEHIYMFPKCSSITSSEPDGIACCSALGGTFIPMEGQLTENQLLELDKKEFKKIFERSARFFGE